MYSPLWLFKEGVAKLVLSTLMTEEHALLSRWQRVHGVELVIVRVLVVIDIEFSWPFNL